MIDIDGASVRQLAETIQSCVREITSQTADLKQSIERLGQTNTDESFDNLRNYVKLAEDVFGTHSEEFNKFVKRLNSVAEKIDRYHATTAGN